FGDDVSTGWIGAGHVAGGGIPPLLDEAPVLLDDPLAPALLDAPVAPELLEDPTAAVLLDDPDPPAPWVPPLALPWPPHDMPAAPAARQSESERAAGTMDALRVELIGSMRNQTRPEGKPVAGWLPDRRAHRPTRRYADRDACTRGALPAGARDGRFRGDPGRL